jgi:E3 ubiquitin-protein ligase HECTD4
MRVTDFVELPHDDISSADDSDHEVVTFDSKSPEELAEQLINICSNHNNAYARLLEYRLNGLKGFWRAQYQLALEEHNQRESASNDETIAMLKKHGLWKEPEQASFSTRVSLLLCLPLLQSQSRTDPRLSSLTTELLLSCLRDCPPLSLGKEPSDCLNGIEALLSSWLGEGEVFDKITDPVHRQAAASALIALACARFVVTSCLFQHFFFVNLFFAGVT